ncbi:MAG: hypothetical protein AB3N33_03240 [Puniceicoccaceae bacterium]
MKRTIGYTAITWLLSVTGSSLPGEIAYGPDARAQFEEYRDRLGDSHVTFDEPEITGGPLGPLTVGGVELTFRTTEQRYPSQVTVDYPVVVLPYSFVTSTRNGTHTLMGSRSSGGLPDGQSRYEIVFSQPQARVGVMRLWSTDSLTRFYNPSGELLGEHQNTTSLEFVAWFAGGPDTNDWVSRVEIDGTNPGGTYQVGETDDLFFGTAKPDGPPDKLGIVHGQDAVDRFTLYREFLGDTLVDFNDLANGPVRQIAAGGETLTLKTLERRYPPPIVVVDYPVCVVPLYGVNPPSGTNELMGSGASYGAPDGQNPYEIVFTNPQHRVAVMRRWNTHSLTRFYAEDGSLLGEHQNTANHEFVGWVGDPGDERTWVKRVLMEGLPVSNTYQVGFTDDLHFGSELPDRDPIEITGGYYNAQKEAGFSWQPAQALPEVEYSLDLINWLPAGGDLSPSSWSGTVDGDPETVFFRVLSGKLFQ